MCFSKGHAHVANMVKYGTIQELLQQIELVSTAPSLDGFTVLSLCCQILSCIVQHDPEFMQVQEAGTEKTVKHAKVGNQ